MKNIPLFKVFVSEDCANSVKEVLSSGWIGQAQKVEDFECELKNIFKNPYINTVNSATSAIHLSLNTIKTLDKNEERNEILTTPLTCINGEQLIKTKENNFIKIRDIVNKELAPEILSYNIKNKNFEYKKVIGWHKSPLGDRKYLRLNYKQSPITHNNKHYSKTGVWLTDDHPILTNSGYIKAKDLKKENLIATTHELEKNNYQNLNTNVFYDEFEINTNFEPEKRRSVYCLDVEDNHNFIVSGIIVHNCTATNLPIIHNNLNIKWVDTNPETCNMDMLDLERKINHKTKAIMVVHWGGNPCDLDKLKEISEKCYDLYGYKPYIIEDCAHVWDGKYKNEIIGNSGNFCVFSFQAIKILTTADGGILISPNEKIHKLTKLKRWFGLDRESSASFRCSQNISEDVAGFKFHMNDVNAAIGIENLKKIKEKADKHKENGKFFDKELKNIPGLNLIKILNNCESSYWIYTISVENRNGFSQKLKEKGIETSQVHRRNDLHDCFKQFKCNLPHTDIIDNKMICIPCGWWVNKEDREYILNTIKEGW